MVKSLDFHMALEIADDLTGRIGLIKGGGLMDAADVINVLIEAKDLAIQNQKLTYGDALDYNRTVTNIVSALAEKGQDFLDTDDLLLHIPQGDYRKEEYVPLQP